MASDWEREVIQKFDDFEELKELPEEGRDRVKRDQSGKEFLYLARPLRVER